VTLKIGKQRELPKRPGDYRTAKGDMNKVPDTASEEAGEIRRRNNPTSPPAKPDKKK
jgi:hypothetical protein